MIYRLHGHVCMGLLLLFMGAIPVKVMSAEPPVIPVGLDAYRMWDRWPQQRIGARAYMRSTYDRAGGNEAADASHFLYLGDEDYNVTLDVEGAGVLYFVRTNHWHGSPWHYVIDGKDTIVKETGTADPVNALKRFTQPTFIPEDLFPNPLTWTWGVTKGADLMWVPLPFEKSLQLAYSRTCYGTGYYIYHQYLKDAKLSQPLKAWDGKTPPAKDVLDLLARAGSDIAPLGIETLQGELAPDREGAVRLARIDQAPATIRALKLILPLDRAIELGKARLKITWDGMAQPSVDAPLALFFGAGTLYNRDQREYLVKALPANIRFDYAAKKVELACYFPMPFFKSAELELTGIKPTNADSPAAKIQYEIRYEKYEGPANHAGYLHATYRDHPTPEAGKDLVLLDTQGAEGCNEWSGNFVGTSFIFSHRSILTTLEGDPRFFFDDSQTPQAYGTGTEEWGGGGDYWGGRNMTLPLAGHPCGAPKADQAQTPEDHIQSAYRFLLADLMPFGKRAVIRLEHGGINESAEHYETVAYWYGLPAAAVVKTDELDVGKVASELAHQYASPEASEPVTITSRYELGVDALPSVKEDGPSAQPGSFAEFEFDADAGKQYFIWARGKALSRNIRTDAFWIQFDDEIGTERQHPSCVSKVGAGNWADEYTAEYSWSSALPKGEPLSVTFDRAGRHRLRIQPRHTPFQLDQLWLSVTQQTRPQGATGPTFAPLKSARIHGEIGLNAASARLCGAIERAPDTKAAGGTALLIKGGKNGREVYAAHAEDGRVTSGSSEFTLKLRPDNQGAFLRRTLDYAYPNQRAEIDVADVSRGQSGDDLKWEYAGAWYLAGSNTCVFSRPKGELDPRQITVQTSNRRFRDDEFLLDRKFTAGRSAIRVRARFTPVRRELYPGFQFPQKPAWSELRYQVYCWVMPDFKACHD